MVLKKFPIGIQDFKKIRDEGKYYVDKTDLIYKLVTTDNYYFLSRPRRFGKSLLISTLQYYFEGRKDLFTGLAIDKLEKDWKKYPVIRLDLSTVKDTSDEVFSNNMNEIFRRFEKQYGIENEYSGMSFGARLSKLITTAHEKTGDDVVVLVDEYDAPVLEAMNDKELLLKVRNRMRDLYSPLKALGGMLRFVFLTGISKFSQLSIFSELNNLKIITMLDEYAPICGITSEELLTQMQPEIQALADKQGISYDEACNALKKKYDGYHFSKNSPDIYNPFSLINALSDCELDNYWFSTGTPTILTRLMKKYNIDPVIFDKGYDASLEMFDVPTELATDPIPMLYQSGYLTIKAYDNSFYTLGFPNEEVSIGFLNALLPYYTKEESHESNSFIVRLVKAFRKDDLETALTEIRSFFSSIPYDAEPQTENHYKTIIFMIFKIITQFGVRTEERSAAGRSDLVVETSSSVFLFEFKLNGNGSAEDAIKQIDDKGYLIPYTTTYSKDGIPKKLYKIGVSFDEEKRTISNWLIKAC